jgi:glycine cleavage system H protein
MTTYPDNLRYTREHEWVRAEGADAVIGITDHAQHELGDIVYVDLPKIGTLLEQGKTFGSVESVKAVSDVYAPASGEVIDVNNALSTAPEKLNEDPHGEAWLVKIKLTVPDEIKQLLSAAEYQKYIGA